jgi:hypothetical protein
MRRSRAIVGQAAALIVFIRIQWHAKRCLFPISFGTFVSAFDFCRFAPLPCMQDIVAVFSTDAKFITELIVFAVCADVLRRSVFLFSQAVSTFKNGSINADIPPVAFAHLCPMHRDTCSCGFRRNAAALPRHTICVHRHVEDSDDIHCNSKTAAPFSSREESHEVGGATTLKQHLSGCLCCSPVCCRGVAESSVLLTTVVTPSLR